MPSIPLGQQFVPKTSHCRFPQHRPSIVNQDINTVNSVPPIVQAHILPSNINVPQRIYKNSTLLIDIDIQSPSCTQQENLIATISNVVPGLETPVFQPTYPYVGPTSFGWSGPQLSAPVPSLADNASLIREFAEAVTSKKTIFCPNAKLHSLMATHYSGMSGIVYSTERLTCSRSPMTLN